MKRIAGVVFLLFIVFAVAAMQREKPGVSADLDRLGVRRQTLTAKTKVDTRGWPQDGASNGVGKRVRSKAVGLARESFPGAKFVTAEATRKLDVAKQRTGLFVVDLEYVPRELPAILARRNLKLRDDGSLVDANGEPVIMFITNETYEVAPQAATRGGYFDLIPSAYAASPFPFRCHSFSPWALYHGGFHRWYEAGTDLAAYGADSRGGCSWESPQTRIDFMQARATVGSPGVIQSCFNCATISAYDTWDVGWFWPAHGIPTTAHSGLWADGSFSFTRTAALSW